MTDADIKALASAAIAHGNTATWWICVEALRGKSWARKILRAREEKK